jgi:NDP-sugar pyrophosphorylase family protein
MKALIISAGRGNRLNELTKDTPKALIPLLGLSLIERVIFTTKEAGIREYVIVIGCLGEKIKAILGNGDRFRVKINDYYNFLVMYKRRILLFKGHETLTYDGS